jgi:hypothetical protein
MFIKHLIIIPVISLLLILTVNGFGQNKKRKHHSRPEVDDRVLVLFRKKHPQPKTWIRKFSRRKPLKKTSKMSFFQIDPRSIGLIIRFGSVWSWPSLSKAVSI